MKKLPTYELTEEGEIDAISLNMAPSEASKIVLIVEDRKGNFHKLGKDGEFHPLPKTQENDLQPEN